jgi:repressor of nif and glnA expression
MGSIQIMRELPLYGIELTERTIRYHLKMMDEQGLTDVHGKSGRTITKKGIAELERSNVSEKIGFISSKIETLSYMSDFDLDTQEGKVVLNVSLFPSTKTVPAAKLLTKVFKSRHVMSGRVLLAHEGAAIGNTVIPKGMVGIGTMCSVTINSIMLKNGIPISSRYGGLLEVTPEGPSRFTSLISYDGCSMDPLLIYIRGGMTSVLRAINESAGTVLASFREVPVACTERVHDIQKKLQEINISGLLAIGNTNQPLLDIPVGLDKTGVIVMGGLNASAALHEKGISTESFAMAELVEYEKLVPFKKAIEALH